jgi:beta-aspartyl-dipeptidase (metallo-type)
MLSSLIKGGITTVVGLLGTDGSTRHVETLFAKAKGLEYEGITTYILTGSYEYPGATITNNIKNDILFIDKVIGVKIALSDHRSSHINKNELIRLASQVRVSSMLSGKAGIITVHMGDAKEGLNLIKEIVSETDIPIKHFMPTHVNRNGNLFEQAIEFVNMGGYMDMTAGSLTNEKNGSLKVSQAIAKCMSRNVCVSNIIISTDGNGSTS